MPGISCSFCFILSEKYGIGVFKAMAAMEKKKNERGGHFFLGLCFPFTLLELTCLLLMRQLGRITHDIERAETRMVHDT